MTERKKLKKELSKLMHYKRSLPRLIDCSMVYGDNFFNEQDMVDTEKRIAEIEKQIIDNKSINN